MPAPTNRRPGDIVRSEDVNDVARVANSAEARVGAVETQVNGRLSETSLTSTIGATVATEFDTRLPGEVAEKLAEQPTIEQAAITAVDGRANGLGLPISVKTHGAKGDGTTDDTAAFAAALTAAAGRTITVPSGTYVLHSLAVTGKANLRLDQGATLLHKPGATNSMIHFTGTHLSIHGGAVDGNKTNQTAWTYLITGPVPEGATVELERVHVRNTVASGLYLSNFGGTVSMQNCVVTGQTEHDGVLGHYTTILHLVSGQGDGKKGLVRFNHNRCYGTDAPALAGGNPGGLFLATNGRTPGAPGSEGFADGNLSTLEAIGNYFYGYGQNAGGNDISPIHTYPTIGGARVIGNYFEACGFSAITAKSVQDFTCANNTIVNGLVSPQNVASEGAIAYLPGYQAASTSRPRAVITGNIISNPGGQPDKAMYGISVHGITTSLADDVTIADNVIDGAGVGIHLDYAVDATIKGNRITAATNGANMSDHGLRVDNVYGTVLVADNYFDAPNGSGMYVLGKVATARFTLTGNVFRTISTTWACILRGASLAKFTGNLFDGASLALSVAGDGTNPTGTLWWDLSNMAVSGTISFNFAEINLARGHITYPNAPDQLVKAPAGTLYTRTSAGGTTMLYVKAGGNGASGWLAADGLDAGTARPTVYLYAGRQFFDTTLGKVITHNGTAWVDAMGATV